ncbi:MAG TPA: dynamin family protein [Acidiferrobacterales bacterium]
MSGKIENLADRRRAREGGETDFAGQVDRYRRWRDGLTETIAEYQSWRERQGLAEGAEDLRIYDLLEALRADKLVVALVGEFSRGKTELLNAIFFPEHQQRLLPSDVGRTTMCPTELLWNEKDGACLKLLPIETRKTALSIAEYKRTPIHWSTLHILKQNSPEEIRELFAEVTRTKTVNRREAEELGLGDYLRQLGEPAAGGSVEIPVWRHAVISFPHPLLKQGLVVLDTPGLNALGAEPELTLNMLPGAHAVLFLLAADTGVTRTDLDIWSNHVVTARGRRQGGLLVVLNKIDALWDGLTDDKAIARSLQRQADETAHALQVPVSEIFPVSAQKGLLAKIRGDQALLARSGLPALEAKLAEEIIPAKHELVRRRILNEISGRVESSRGLLGAKLDEINKQHAELKALGGQNLDAIRRLTETMRAEKQRYDKEVEGFQVTRNALGGQAKTLLEHLSLASIDQLIKKTRRDMRDSWTTAGLKNGMATFFAGAVGRMDKVAAQGGEIRRSIGDIYARLHQEYGMTALRPTILSLVPYLAELKKLETQAEQFRDSPLTVMTEQEFVIRKFFIALVSQVRSLFDECNAYVKGWFQDTMAAVSTQIEGHRQQIEAKLADLRGLHENLDSLGERLAELEAERQRLSQQLAEMDQLLERIHAPMTP